MMTITINNSIKRRRATIHMKSTGLLPVAAKKKLKAKPPVPPNVPMPSASSSKRQRAITEVKSNLPMPAGVKVKKPKANESLSPTLPVPSASDKVASGQRGVAVHGSDAARNDHGPQADTKVSSTGGSVPADQSKGGVGEGQSPNGDDHDPVAFPYSRVRENYYRRESMIRMRIAVENNCRGSMLRALGFKWMGKKRDLQRIKKQAARCIELIWKHNDPISAAASLPKEFAELPRFVVEDVLLRKSAYVLFNDAADRLEASIIADVRTHPVWPWIKAIRGTAEGSLARIIGECGDLMNYPKIECVWKRLGLAPLNGKSAAQWVRTGGLTKEEWIKLGYNRARRSSSWNIAEALFKSQGKSGPYRKIYDDRKSHTAQTHPEWTKGHRHADAKRIMEKTFLELLYEEWKRLGKEGK